MRVSAALRAATDNLAEASDTARLDAELLMAHALGVSRSDLLLRHMGDAVPEGFMPLVSRRMSHEPVAYIIGYQEFFSLPFAVTSDVLIPRADSEVLVEAAKVFTPQVRCIKVVVVVVVAMAHPDWEALVPAEIVPMVVPTVAATAEPLPRHSFLLVAVEVVVMEPQTFLN